MGRFKEERRRNDETLGIEQLEINKATTKKCEDGKRNREAVEVLMKTREKLNQDNECNKITKQKKKHNDNNNNKESDYKEAEQMQ